MNNTLTDSTILPPQASLHRLASRNRQSILLAAAVAVAGWVPLIQAGPPKVQIGQVIHGTATLSQQGSQTLINATNGAIINFKQFDVPSGTTVNIILPSASGRLLDRITSGSPSQINGTLQSNGTIYFVNPSGIVFGAGSVVGVKRLVVVGGQMTDADFTAGHDQFHALSGTVENDGLIRASDVTLTGKTVINTGTIVADGGAVALVTGQDVLLGEKNSHVFAKINASGSAKARFGSGDVYSVALNTSGHIQATHVLLQSDPGAGVSVSGSVDASQKSSGAVGGSIDITGGSVAVNGATLTASGFAGGGTINIGGNQHGQGPLPNAAFTSVGKDSFIHADASGSGNGGNIVIWSNQQTTFSGTLTARGATRGNGGAAEISSHNLLAFTGSVDLGAPAGSTGTLLLDPASIEITNNTTTAIDAQFTGTINANEPGTSGQTTTLSAFDLVNASKTANISLQATSSITLDSGVITNVAGGTEPGLILSNGLRLAAPSISLQSLIVVSPGSIILTGLNGPAANVYLPPAGPSGLSLQATAGEIIIGTKQLTGGKSVGELSALRTFPASGGFFYSGTTGSLSSLGGVSSLTNNTAQFAAAVNPVTIIAGNVGVVQSPVAIPAQPLSSVTRAQLQQLGIFVKEQAAATGDRYQIIDNWPHKLAPDASEREVSPNRLSAATLALIVEHYQRLFGSGNEKRGEVRGVIQKALADFKQEPTPAAFAQFVNTSPAENSRGGTRDTLLDLKHLRDDIAHSGLSPAEATASYVYWMSPLVEPIGHDWKWLNEVLDAVKERK